LIRWIIFLFWLAIVHDCFWLEKEDEEARWACGAWQAF
jgi:hypothetical protein